MWYAYHIDVSVPAYSTVSCREKPTFSLASTSRRLRQVGASTSRSVPTISARERTITGSPHGCGGGSGRSGPSPRAGGRGPRRGGTPGPRSPRAGGAQRLGEDVHTGVQLVGGNGQRR